MEESGKRAVPTYFHHAFVPESGAAGSAEPVTLSIENTPYRTVSDLAALKKFANAAVVPLSLIAAASLNSTLNTVPSRSEFFNIMTTLSLTGASFFAITAILLLIAIQIVPDNSLKELKTFPSTIVFCTLAWFISLFYAAFFSVFKSFLSPMTSVIQVDANGQYVERNSDNSYGENYGSSWAAWMFISIFMGVLFLMSFWALNLLLYRTFFRSKKRLVILSSSLCVVSVAVFFAIAYVLSIS